MVERIAAGDLAAARAIAHGLRPLIRALFAEPNPGPLKAALALLGLVRDGLRLPMTRASEACRARIEVLLPAVMALC